MALYTNNSNAPYYLYVSWGVAMLFFLSSATDSSNETVALILTYCVVQLKCTEQEA